MQVDCAEWFAGDMLGQIALAPDFFRFPYSPQVHPDGNMRLKTPCVTATFPIFGGMSGGPVLRLQTGQAPAAFGILSSDFEQDIEEKYDYATCGTTNVAKLPLEWTVDEQGGRVAQFKYVSDEIGNSAPLQKN